jgi:MarR family 2-MHQ and catechol resistance regulon transcriptional repressor
MTASESSAVRIWRSFVRAKAEIGRVMHRELRARGLTGAQFGILRVLADSGNEGIKLHELSERLYVTSGNVTGLIDRLEEAGYLARIPHAQDRRITLAVLTTAGQELFDEIYPAHLARIQHLMSALTAREQRLCADLLERLAERAAEMCGPADR